MSTHDEDRLRTTLRARADHAEVTPLDLEAVRGRARGIRRRRAAVAVLSTAAVVALAVPAGLALTDGPDRSDELPVADRTPGDTLTPPSELREVALLTDARPGGEDPSLALLRDGEIVTPQGSVAVPGEGTPASLALLGDSWMVLMDLGDGRYTLDMVGADGRLQRTAPAQAAPVLSDDGTVAAYVARNGDVHGVAADGTGLMFATADEVGPGPQVGAVLGSGDCRQSPGCTVYVDSGAGGVRVAAPDGTVADLPGFLSVDDADGARVVGTVSAADAGSCSALRDGSEEVWRTCDNSLGQMSPDGRWAVGYPAYTDGLGPRSVSVVDMADGRERVRFFDDGRTDTHVRQAIWESDTSLLLLVWDGEDRSWSILRAGIDGSLSEVETGLPGDETDPSVHLPVR